MALQFAVKTAWTGKASTARSLSQNRHKGTSALVPQVQSNTAQIPLIVDVAHASIELTALIPPNDGEELTVFLSQVSRKHATRFETIQSPGPVSSQGNNLILQGDTFGDTWAGCALIRQTVMNASEDAGADQVGIRIRASNTVLDSQIFRVADRYP